jgi:hypothetical protein
VGFLEGNQAESHDDNEWHLNDFDTQQLERHERGFELRILEIIERVQQQNVRAARLNLAATIILGIIVVVLCIMQVRLSKPPTVVIQQQQQQQPPGDQQPFKLGPQGDSPHIHGTGGK